jgi:hypothetical protein
LRSALLALALALNPTLEGLEASFRRGFFSSSTARAAQAPGPSCFCRRFYAEGETPMKPLTVKPPRPRNPFVAPSLQRQAGIHRRGEAHARQTLARRLRDELNDLQTPSE